jgi:thiol-disulfide isomerase/thioredoxin
VSSLPLKRAALLACAFALAVPMQSASPAASAPAAISPAAGGAPVAKELRPWKGGATPALMLRDVQKRVYDLKSYRGKVVLVNFWASWCEPCLQEMPAMEDLEQRMKGRPFEVLAVNFAEGEERVAAFLENYGIKLNVLFDKDMAVSKRWNARILPASYLVGADGRIRYSVIGEADWTAPRMVAAVEELLREARDGASMREASGRSDGTAAVLK